MRVCLVFVLRCRFTDFAVVVLEACGNSELGVNTVVWFSLTLHSHCFIILGVFP